MIDTRPKTAFNNFAALLSLGLTIVLLWYVHEIGLIAKAPNQKKALLNFLSLLPLVHLFRVFIPQRFTFSSFIIVSILSMSLASNGSGAAVSILLYVLAAISLGLLIFYRGAQKISAFDVCSSFFLGSSLYIPFIWISLHFPINNAVYYIIIFLTPVVYVWKNLDFSKLDFEIQTDSFKFFELHEVLKSTAITHLFVILSFGLIPEHMPDALITYLPFMDYVKDNALWHFSLDISMFSKFSYGFLYLQTAVYTISGESAAKVMPWVFMTAACAMLYSYPRRADSKLPYLLAILLLLSTPLTFLLCTSIFYDFQSSILCFVALLVLLRSEKFSSLELYILACLLGGAIAVKLSAGLLAVVIGLFALVRLIHDQGSVPSIVKEILGPVIVGVLIFALPHLESYITSGNPFLPLFEKVFPSTYTKDLDFTSPFLGQTPSFQLLHSYFFDTSRFMETEDGTVGFHFLVLLPISFMMLLVQRSWNAVFVSVAVLFILVFQVTLDSNLRYLYLGFPIFCFLIALALKNTDGSRISKTSIVSAVGLLYVANLAFTVNIARNLINQDLFTAYSSESRDTFIDSYAFQRNLCEALESITTNDPKLFVVNTNSCGPSSFQIETNSWHFPTLWMNLLKAKEVSTAGEILNNRGYSHILLHSEIPYHNKKVIQEAIDKQYRIIYEKHYYRLYERINS